MLLACIALICLPSYTPYSHPKIRNSPLGILFKSRCIVLSIAIVDVNTPVFRDNLHVHPFRLPNHLVQPDLGPYQISLLTYTRRARPSVHRSPSVLYMVRTFMHSCPSWSPAFTEAVSVTAPFRLNSVNLYVLDDCALPLILAGNHMFLKIETGSVSPQ